MASCGGAERDAGCDVRSGASGSIIINNINNDLRERQSAAFMNDESRTPYIYSERHRGAAITNRNNDERQSGASLENYCIPYIDNERQSGAAISNRNNNERQSGASLESYCIPYIDNERSGSSERHPNADSISDLPRRRRSVRAPGSQLARGCDWPEEEEEERAETAVLLLNSALDFTRARDSWNWSQLVDDLVRADPESEALMLFVAVLFPDKRTDANARVLDAARHQQIHVEESPRNDKREDTRVAQYIAALGLYPSVKRIVVFTSRPDELLYALQEHFLLLGCDRRVDIVYTSEPADLDRSPHRDLDRRVRQLHGREFAGALFRANTTSAPLENFAHAYDEIVFAKLQLPGELDPRDRRTLCSNVAAALSGLLGRRHRLTALECDHVNATTLRLPLHAWQRVDELLDAVRKRHKGDLRDQFAFNVPIRDNEGSTVATVIALLPYHARERLDRTDKFAAEGEPLDVPEIAPSPVLQPTIGPRQELLRKLVVRASHSGDDRPRLRVVLFDVQNVEKRLQRNPPLDWGAERERLSSKGIRLAGHTGGQVKRWDDNGMFVKHPLVHNGECGVDAALAAEAVHRIGVGEIVLVVSHDNDLTCLQSLIPVVTPEEFFGVEEQPVHRPNRGEPAGRRPPPHHPASASPEWQSVLPEKRARNRAKKNAEARKHQKQQCPHGFKCKYLPDRCWNQHTEEEKSVRRKAIDRGLGNLHIFRTVECKYGPQCSYRDTTCGFAHNDAEAICSACGKKGHFRGNPSCSKRGEEVKKGPKGRGGKGRGGK